MVLLAEPAFSFTGAAAGEGAVVTEDEAEEGRSLIVCFAPGIAEGGLTPEEGAAEDAGWTGGMACDECRVSLMVCVGTGAAGWTGEAADG